mgnify:CR=1 FL=1
MMGFGEVIGVNAAILIVLSALGVFGAWGFSRALDRANDKWSCGFQFGLALAAIKESPIASAIYYGARWLGICIMFGFLFSRAV